MNSRQVLESWAMAVAQECFSLSKSSVMSLLCYQFSWKTGSVSLTHESGLDFEFTFLSSSFFFFFSDGWEMKEMTFFYFLGETVKVIIVFALILWEPWVNVTWIRPNERSQGQKGPWIPKAPILRRPSIQNQKQWGRGRSTGKL